MIVWSHAVSGLRTSSPGERVVHDLALGQERSAVPGVERKVIVVGSHLIGEKRVVPVNAPPQRTRVRVDQELVGVEAVPLGRCVRSVDAVPVELPGAHVGSVEVPDLVGKLLQGQAGDLAATRFIKQAELDRFRVGGEEGEVGSAPVPGGSERVGLSRPQPEVM
jgi:hypothetical protein